MYINEFTYIRSICGIHNFPVEFNVKMLSYSHMHIIQCIYKISIILNIDVHIHIVTICCWNKENDFDAKHKKERKKEQKIHDGSSTISIQQRKKTRTRTPWQTHVHAGTTHKSSIKPQAQRRHSNKRVETNTLYWTNG